MRTRSGLPLARMETVVARVQEHFPLLRRVHRIQPPSRRPRTLRKLQDACLTPVARLQFRQ